VRRWLVGSALIEGEDGLLLVANRRRDGAVDWTPPGGVIDAGESVLDGIVVDARFTPVDECDAALASSWVLLREPVGAWLQERWDDDGRLYRYRLQGADRASMVITRLDG